MSAIRKKKRQKKSTGILTLDIAKAFDTVWHDGLITKLNLIDTPIHLTKLIQDWLKQRQFYVVVGDAKSSMRAIPTGVPQGSAISPLLYSLFVADIPWPNECKLAIYADDTAILAHSNQARGVASRLKKGFETINEFFTKWRIKVNSSKTEVVNIKYIVIFETNVLHFASLLSGAVIFNSAFCVDRQEVGVPHVCFFRLFHL